MKTVHVKAQDDHLTTLSRTSRPEVAIGELIWNGLDADANSVRVEFVRSILGPVEKILIRDDGHGISATEVEDAFGHLGGSWKRLRDTTREQGRLLHGKEGKGRFRAFALGEHVTWITRYLDQGKLRELQVTGNSAAPGRFVVSDLADAAPGASRGTEVAVESVYESLPDLQRPSVVEELAEIFAIYLTQYRNVSLIYDGVRLDPASLVGHSNTYALDAFELEGVSVPAAELAVLEWKRSQTRSLYLCDADGFTLGRLNPGIHARGFDFTAYLLSSYIRQLEDEGTLSLTQFNPQLDRLVEEAKGQLRAHFRDRAAEEARNRVEDWKRERVYPYEGEPKSIVERATRQVFDVVAFSVSNYLPRFEESDRGSRRLSFQLIRQALEENPRSLHKILQEVLRLPKEAQDDLATLLERTSLTAVIEAAKVVADRLDFLAGLELLVFRPDTREQLQERAQLHRILATETWVFGERFNLSVDDRSLTEVLRRHRELLRRESPDTLRDNIRDEDLAPVLRADGRAGIVDLMLSCQVPQPRPEAREHLVIELKRPTQAINSSVLKQIDDYAYAIERDDRFRHTDTRWEFWAVTNRITEDVLRRMTDQEDGIYRATHDARMTIRLRTWGEILEDCRGRLTFFQDRLQYALDDESALGYLRRAHEKYLPAAIATDATTEPLPAVEAVLPSGAIP